MEIWQEKLAVIMVGLLLLGWGHQFYWLFVGTAGFLAGFKAATTWAVSLSSLHQLLIAIAGGLLGIIAAVAVRRVAFAFAGFVIGGYAAITLSAFLGLTVGVTPLILFLLGGLSGLALIALMVDWALIGLSSLAGALLIAVSLVEEADYFKWVVLGLFILGFIVQEDRRQRHQTH